MKNTDTTKNTQNEYAYGVAGVMPTDNYNNVVCLRIERSLLTNLISVRANVEGPASNYNLDTEGGNGRWCLVRTTVHDCMSIPCRKL